MSALARAVTLVGNAPLVVDVCADRGADVARAGAISPPLPISRHTRDRVRAAIVNSGRGFLSQSVRITCSTAHPRSEADMAVAAAILHATGVVPGHRLADTALVGELTLDGRTRSVHRIADLAAAAAASAHGFRHLVVPAADAGAAVGASHGTGLTIVPIAHLTELITWLTSTPGPRTPVAPPDPKVARALVPDAWTQLPQATVRAAALAAAGGHHTLCLARPDDSPLRVPRLVAALMPDLADPDAREVTHWHRQIRARLPADSLITRPPRIRTHYSNSLTALAGSPTRPGLITLAHRGVLEVPDLPEFPDQVIAALYPALRYGEITLTGPGGTVRRPAAGCTVFTTSPCPGGCTTVQTCSCTPAKRLRYLHRIPGWLLARVDLFVFGIRLTTPDPALPSLTEISAAVAEAHRRAARRWGAPPSPAQVIADTELARGLPSQATDILATAVTCGEITATTASRLLRLAWTAADLDSRPRPDTDDIERMIADRRTALRTLSSAER